MAELKTQKSTRSVYTFIETIDNSEYKEQCKRLLKIMEEASGDSPSMWGASIVGFGSYNYKYANGKPANWFEVGFSPRKQSLSIYLMQGFDNFEDLLNKLGKHKIGKSCLYIKNLDSIDVKVLRELIQQSILLIRERSK